MLRKIRRNILRNKLKKAGFTKINKSTVYQNGRPYKVKSIMARYWHYEQMRKGV